MRTKLLLADDSITIQKVVGIIFASDDYELTIVDNGTAALAKAREILPDVFLVDAVMPGKSGYEVCEEVRRDPTLKSTPILLLTGAFEPFDEAKARECGADDFISKPFESQHLIDKVMGLVDLGKQRALAVPLKAAVPSPEWQAQPAPTPRPVPSAPLAAAQVADALPDFFTFEEEPAPPPAPAPAPAAAQGFELEMVEGTADDDLWGAFELEDVAEGEAAEPGESPFSVEVLAAGTTAAAQPAVAAGPGDVAAEWGIAEAHEFSFAEEAAAPQVESVPAGEFGVFEENAALAFETAPSSAEDFFVTTDEPPAADDGEINPFAPPAEQVFDLQFAAEEEYVPLTESPTASAVPSPSPAGGGFDFQFAPDEEFMPAPAAPAAVAAFGTAVPTPDALRPEPLFAPEEEFMPAPAALAETVPPAPPSPAPATVAEVALSDDQLAALVAKISRDIIEKIAWEVVPDLAESIIKEEIRKIKEGN